MCNFVLPRWSSSPSAHVYYTSQLGLDSFIPGRGQSQNPFNVQNPPVTLCRPSLYANPRNEGINGTNLSIFVYHLPFNNQNDLYGKENGKKAVQYLRLNYRIDRTLNTQITHFTFFSSTNESPLKV